MAHKKSNKQQDTLSLFLTCLSHYKLQIVLMLAAVLVDMVAMMSVPTEISSMVNATLDVTNTTEINKHVVRMAIAVLFAMVGDICMFYLATRVSAYVGHEMRLAVYKKTLYFSSADFDNFGTATMITRTLSDVNVVQQALVLFVVVLLPVPIVCIYSLVSCYMLSFTMGNTILAMLLLLMAFLALSQKMTSPIYRKLQNFVDRINARLRENVTGVRVVRAFGRESEASERLDTTFDEYAEQAIQTNLIFAVINGLVYFVIAAAQALVVYVAINEVGAYALQIGSVTVLLSYITTITTFLANSQYTITLLPRAAACLKRTNEVFNYEPSIKDAQDALRLESSDFSGQDRTVARFRDVSLRYPANDMDTLRHISFELKQGTTTAIIGSTAAGKTTIAKLLLRMIDATEGSVEFFDHSVKDLAIDDIRDHIAYVPQRAWLFKGTIASNLRYGNAKATNEVMWHAIDVAQANFVRKYPRGLDAPVSQGGTNFSGGQRQRLTIARALVRKAELYIFDDSFSALDFKTDVVLREALKTEIADAAVLIIAQRINTVRDADQIIVLNDGQIEGIGTHDELLKSCAFYKALAKSQTGEEATDVCS